MAETVCQDTLYSRLRVQNLFRSHIDLTYHRKLEKLKFFVLRIDMINQQSNEGIVQSGGTINANQLAVGRLAAISGTVNKTINETAEMATLVDLLGQLRTAIESDSQLSPSDKVEALEQVNEIAKVGNAPINEPTQKIAKTASRTLKGMIAELPQATQFVEACTKLLPLITKIFGF
jgi:hypothetical protein